MKQNRIAERLINGLVRENPTFVLMLGMCPTLAVTTSAVNGLGMGLTTMVVLALSNMFISLLRKIIPDKVRIPAFIVIIASFVTVVELLLKAFIPFLYDALGLYIPLIVVNCIILGRAEAYASKNDVTSSLFDGVGMGLGFTVALTIIGAVRELLGAGEVFGLAVMPESYVPCSIFVMAPGAFFVLAVLTAIQNKVKIAGEKKGRDMSKVQSGCGFDCMNCAEAGCESRRAEEAAPQKVREPDLEVIEITDDEDGLEDAPLKKAEAEPEPENVSGSQAEPEPEKAAQKPMAEPEPEKSVEEKAEAKPEEAAEKKAEAEPEEAAENQAEAKAEEAAGNQTEAEPEEAPKEPAQVKPEKAAEKQGGSEAAKEPAGKPAARKTAVKTEAKPKKAAEKKAEAEPEKATEKKSEAKPKKTSVKKTTAEPEKTAKKKTAEKKAEAGTETAAKKTTDVKAKTARKAKPAAKPQAGQEKADEKKPDEINNVPAEKEEENND